MIRKAFDGMGFEVAQTSESIAPVLFPPWVVVVTVPMGVRAMSPIVSGVIPMVRSAIACVLTLALVDVSKDRAARGSNDRSSNRTFTGVAVQRSQSKAGQCPKRRA